MSNAQFFIAQSASLARSLPLKEGVKFLHGLLLIAGDSPEVGEIRKLYVSLAESERQLELLEANQLRLFPNNKKKVKK